MFSPSTSSALRAAAQQAADNPAGRVLSHGAPEITMQHAAATGRVGFRLGMWGLRTLLWRPVLVALVAWPLWMLVHGIAETAAANPVIGHPVGFVCDGSQCMPTNDGTGTQLFRWESRMTRPAGTWATAADVVLVVAEVATIGGLTLGALNLVTRTPAQRALAQQRVAAARQSQRAGGGVRAGWRGVRSDWTAAKRDVAGVNRRLTRVGKWRATRWGRRWAREAAAGVEYTNPGRVDRWLIRHTDPSKKARKAAAAARKAEAKAARQFAKDRAAELKRQEAQIAGRDVARSLAEDQLLDPNDGPPHPPTRVEESPEVAGWRRQAESTEAVARRRLENMARNAQASTGWVGHEPIPAPTNGSRP